MAEVGQLIDDKYEILAQLGKGGMSKVFLAMDRRLNKQWAVKEIQKRGRDENNEVFVQSAIAEANLIKQFDHPHIVRIVDIIEDENVIDIIEDYVEGRTLKEIMDDEGPQDQEKVVNWAKQICSALEYLHSRPNPIIYRDMKPDNVMLRPNDGVGDVKIIDFGIAREYKAKNLADTVCLGTRGYAAPEQFGGQGQTDARTDIYCLGVTLYSLLTGQNPAEPPYEIRPIRQWNPALSSGLETIILKCTQPDPNMRYQSCAELMYALKHYKDLETEHIAAQKKKRNIFFASAGAFAASMLIGIFSQVMGQIATNNDYNDNLLRAERENTTEEEKVAYYMQAISIKPTEITTYKYLVDTFSRDLCFTTEEELQLKKAINDNLMDLQQEEGYAELASQIGRMYWNFYDYGNEGNSDNQVTCMLSAIPWFADAITYGSQEDDFYLLAQTYLEIGEFNRDINMNIANASDNGLYAPYWENLEKLVDEVSAEEDVNEQVQLQAYRLVVNSIDSYARKFKADGVKKDVMTSLLNRASSLAKDVEIYDTSEDSSSKRMQNEIASRSEAAHSAIAKAYRG